MNQIKHFLKIIKWPKSLNQMTFGYCSYNVVPLLMIFIFLLLIKNSDQQQEQQQSSSYRLVGSSMSYAQYAPWYPCLNGSLIFEFKTHEPNGLLVYTQSPPYKYIQISLVDGHLRMRMRIGEKDNPRGVFLVYQKTKLNDEKWHEIRVTRMNERTLLTIDNAETLFHVHQDANLEGNDLYFGDFNNDYQENGINLLVFGGLPNEIQTFDLSLGTALFEHRYNGFIRNARISNCSAQFTRLNVINSNNLRFITEKIDPCFAKPCLNGGVCLVVTDSLDNYKCDCSFTNYEGKNCDKIKSSKSSQEITFSGKDYFSFQIPNSKSFATTYEEEFNLEFKTSRSTGLLLYAGDAQDYFVMGLQDGGIYFKLNIKGQSSSEKTLTIPGTFLHNNHWHSVKFMRKTKKIEILIDQMKREHLNLTGDFISMQTRVIYIGGTPKQNTIYRTIRKNFIGCLRNVTFKSDTIALNLVDMALNDSIYIRKEGTLQKTCRKIMDPISFSSTQSYIPVPHWRDYPKFYSFSIEFQTTENNGVLAYILGSNINAVKSSNNNNNKQQANYFNRDFFALEIHNRFLNAYFNLGSNYIRHEVVHEHVSSGKSHQITVEINDNYALFKFDQRPETTIKLSSSSNEQLELTGPLIIGGIHPSHTTMPGSNPSVKIPPYFYSGMLSNGFVGCIQDLEVNGAFVNLTQYALLEAVSGVNTEMCTPMPNQCDIGNCMNDGVCLEGWNRFYCDCSATGFNGPICNQPAMIANFEEGQHMRIKFEPEWISEAEHLSLRFKTNSKKNSLLLSTYSAQSKDMMEISLENTQIKLLIKIGNAESIIYSKEGFNDNKWHTLKLTREGNQLILQLDNDEPAMDYMNLSNYKALSYGRIDVAQKQNSNLLAPFTGQMQQLIINGKSYFELINNGDMEKSVNKTVSFLRADLPHKYPITIHNTRSWLALPKIDAFHILIVQFHFKTKEENGLILYNSGHNNDYIAVELVNGQIHYIFSLGKENNVIKSKSKEKLNDNKWHLVTIWRPTKTNFELSLDSLVYKFSSNSNEYNQFNLIDRLYVAGLRDESEYKLLISKDKINSFHGFKGCLASVEINGRVPSFDDVLNSKDKMSGQISKGCESSVGCEINVCKNGGQCIEKWEENKQTCNCDQTSFTGNNCELMSTGYMFDKSNIIYEYKSPLIWQEDYLVFGIQTQSPDATLFKAYSLTNNKTLLIELVNGFIQAKLTDNNGLNNVHVFNKYQINDNKYHEIKFNVLESNSSFKVDGFTSKKETFFEKPDPLNKPYQILSDTSKIIVQIGGTNKAKETLENKKDHLVTSKPTSSSSSSFTSFHTSDKPFNGNIFGLVYNQFRILDLLAVEDSRLKTNGRLNLIESVSSESSIKPSSVIDCSDSNSINYDINQCGENNIINKLDDLDTDSDTIESIESETNNNWEAENNKNKYIPDQLEIESSRESTTSMSALNEATTQQGVGGAGGTGTLNVIDDPTKTNYSVIIGATIASILFLVLILFALYKYRNRDEGSYVIDETKNCGPFAELDAYPLNGVHKGNGCNSNNNNNNNNRRKSLKNKEWFV